MLLPGDPGRALALAQMLLVKPLMFNHHRGLWGYTGPARADGELLTIQSTGMGGPSAAIVLTELLALGVRRAIRVGTCGALAPGLSLGELIVARDSISADGTSQALGADGRVAADPSLTDALLHAAAAAQAQELLRTPRACRHDRQRRPVLRAHQRAGTGQGREQHTADALAIEMEAATLFAVAAAASVHVACLLTVTDTFDARGARTRIDDESLLQAAEAMGALAIAALSS